MELKTKALLARLSTGLPGETRKDKNLTAKVQKTENMGSQSGKWLKLLYPPEALETAKQIQGSARTEHYRLTLPWDDQGWRILPTTTYLEYQGAIREKKQLFADAKETFKTRWPDWTAWAAREHNGQFEPLLYDLPKALGAFRLDSDFQPIPDGSDFRVSLQTADVDVMKADLDERLKVAVADAQNDLWMRLRTPVAAMVDRLSNPDATFRDTLVENLRDIVTLVPQLNLTGDPRIEQFAAECKEKLGKWSPDTLRDSKRTRADTAQAAADILKRMEGLNLPVIGAPEGSAQ